MHEDSSATKPKQLNKTRQSLHHGSNAKSVSYTNAKDSLFSSLNELNTHYYNEHYINYKLIRDHWGHLLYPSI